MTEDEGFLQRWSRRKQSALRDAEIQQDEESDNPRAEDETVPAPEASCAQPPSEERDAQATSESESEPPGDEDMPPLESIDEGGSVQPFFSPRVSEGLRRAALRRLFRQPKYNVVDMLDDYAEDYSKPAALGSIVTADMRYRAEQVAKRMERIYKESIAGEETAESEDRSAGEPAHQAAGPGHDPDAVDDKALAGSEEPGPSDQESPEDSDRQAG